ncbi:putative ABC transporter ATP-binding protein (plasmid) [Acidiphilium multivorum AIU301]|uniref:Putative ABC transporter ATP-binding protein n=1 Tax=Acidiphilium multivorum (strain DSM 11245 / JCM 8867 / NBRC 100883 / AIU 301) TaxID=926570 RepID=F0J7U5_ACIMA|nr:ABC transporter ATP-binding protein [Acidiphilium multivorum]BAJ83162.1 putative ABC transporter ATP-binding protein [Acidiphilium multivorum AIU301]GAN72946.1 ABC transporter [Acidiphilium multivorum AIU301]
MTIEAPLLEVSDLRVSFRTRRGVMRAVDGVSFVLGRREILGVVGESGSGKSVSLMAVMGLIDDPNAIVEGSIRFEGRELVGLADREMRRLRGGQIAMIFQDPMTALTPVYSVGRQIVEQLRLHTDLAGCALKARALELLEAVGIPGPRDVIERFPHQLSGGMRQRVVIAMALSCNPALVIADEPTTALDVTVQAAILDLIRNLRRDFGSSIILVTHNMGVVAEIADRVAVMYAGRIVEQADRRAIFQRPRHPYTVGLLGSIPPMTGVRPRRLPSISGAPPALDQLPPGCSFAPRCPHRSRACVVRPEMRGDGHRYACVLAALPTAGVLS